MKIVITLNIDKLLRAAKREPQIAIEEMQKAVEKSAYKIEEVAKKIEAPRKTGNLRKNINTTIKPLMATVKSRANYSIYVHEGTKPHTIVPVKKKVLADKRKGIIFGKKVNHPGTKPNPFMKRTVDRETNTIIKYFNEAVDNILKRI